MNTLGVASGERRTIPVRKNLFDQDEPGRAVLLGSRCKKCGNVFFPQKAYCDYCHTGDLIDQIWEDMVEIHTFTIVRQASPEFKVPYAIGRVDVDEGVRIFTQLLADDLDKIEVGQSVELVLDRLFDDTDGTEITGFKYRVVRR